jgi:pimeloyl-ACP methyl ester carboxylesterase
MAPLIPMILATALAQGEPLTAPGPLAPLQGTYQPARTKKAPVVLIIPGSGPTDRDGNNPLGITAATYRLLAEGLAAHGIASVRVDKRGLFGSKAAVEDANAVTIADYASDTASWIGAIRKRTGAPCVWVLGHSEGALVALVAAQRNDAAICGLILAAGAGRLMGALLKTQLQANPANAPLLPAADAAIDSLAAGEHVDPASLPGPLRALFNPAVQGFLISAFALDPAKLAGATRVPILVLQGRRDLQVEVADAEALAGANPRAKLIFLSDVNHVLKAVHSGDRAPNLATYSDSSLPLAPGVIEAIESFIKAAGG